MAYALGRVILSLFFSVTFVWGAGRERREYDSMSRKVSLCCATLCPGFSLDAPQPTGWPKKRAHLFVCLNFTRLNFIKYWPIFKLISLSESKVVLFSVVAFKTLAFHKVV